MVWLLACHDKTGQNWSKQVNYGHVHKRGISHSCQALLGGGWGTTLHLHPTKLVKTG